MCDSFVALRGATRSGGVIFAKNSDRKGNESQYLECLPGRRHRKKKKLRLTYIEINQAPTTHAVLLSRPHWIWGAEMGANEYGVVIGNEAIFSNVPVPTPDGIIGMDLLRLGLERASNVDEAVNVMTELLAKYGQGGNCSYQETRTYHNSFIIADLTQARVLETVDRDWVVRPIETLDAISNALTTETDFAKSSNTLEETAERLGLNRKGDPLNFRRVFEDSIASDFGCKRRHRSLALLAAKRGTLTINDAYQILRDHGEAENHAETLPPRLCLHTDENRRYATTVSMVSSLEHSKQVHWVTGTGAPCTSIFKPVLIEVGLPPHGATPGANEGDSDSLWWRHENVRRYLATATPQITRSYALERDALEEEFVRLIEECPAPTDPQSIESCARAVAACWQKAQALEDKSYRAALSNDETGHSIERAVRVP